MAAAPEAGSAPAGEGEGSPAPKKPSRWRRGVPGFDAFVPGEGEGQGRLTSLGLRGLNSLAGFSATTSCLGTCGPRWLPLGSKHQSLHRPACTLPHPHARNSHLPQAYLQK